MSDMHSLVDIGRRLSVARSTLNTTNAEEMLSLVEGGHGEPMTWNDALKHRVVLVVGRANTGKTSELNLLMNRLNSTGGKAFFLPLRALYREVDQTALFSSSRLAAFEEWKLNAAGDATFLLDSVDEAELSQEGAFEICLRRFRRQLTDEQVLRARWVISTRPGSWTSSRLLDTIQSELLPPQPFAIKEKADADAFEVEQLPAQSSSGVLLSALAPLTDKETLEILQRAFLVDDPKRVVTLAGNLGMSFALHSPGDLKWLASLLNRDTPPSSRLEAFEVAAQELASPRKHEMRVSKEVLLRELEMLAAANVFCETGLFAIRDSVNTEGALSLQRLLAHQEPDFEELLLALPLVSDASFGRVKFVPEQLQFYLAARWLQSRIGGVGEGRALMDLFRRESMVGAIVPQQLLVTAGWLSSMNPQFRECAIEFAPQVVLLLGDVSKIPLQEAKRALHAVCLRLSNGFPLMPTDIRLTDDDFWQAARPDLVDELVKCMSTYEQSALCMRFLLKTLKSRRSPVPIPAMKKYLPIAPTEYLQGLCVAALAESSEVLDLEWAAKLLLDRGAIRPTFGVDLVVSLIRHGAKPEIVLDVCKCLSNSNFGLAYHLESCAADADNPERVLDYAAALLSVPPSVVPSADTSDGYSGLAPMAAMASALLKGYLNVVDIPRHLFERVVGLLESLRHLPSEDSGWLRFDDFPELFQEHLELKEAAVTMLLDSVELADIWKLTFSHGWFYLQVDSSDHATLRRIAEGGSAAVKKKVESLIARTAAQPDKAEVVVSKPKPSEDVRILENRSALLADVTSFQNASDLPKLVRAAILARPPKDRSRYSLADWQRFELLYGADIAHAVKAGIRKLWREHSPLVDKNQPNTVYHQTVVGLMALNLELMLEGGLEKIATAEAAQAFGYSLFEMNQFPDWFNSLAERFPLEFSEFISSTVVQWKDDPMAYDKAKTLVQRLSHMDSSKLPPDFLAALWDATFSQAWTDDYSLERALRLLATSPIHRTQLFVASMERLELEWEAADSSKFVIWFSLALMLNPLDSVKWLEKKAHLPGFAERLLGVTARYRDTGLLSDRGTRTSEEQCQLLTRLFLLLATAFPSSTDISRFGTFTPRSRDEVSWIRDSLLSRIAQEGGQVAQKYLYLVGTREDVPEAEMRWIHQLAFDAAEKSAKRPAWTVEEFIEYARRCRAPIADEQSLWIAVKQDLDEVIRNLREGQFSIREMLRRCSEHDMQHWMARELQLLSAGRYSLVREPEQADKTAPDIVAQTSTTCKATLELKVADARNVDSLIYDLTKQLHDDYLIAEDSNHGMFVVMWKEDRVLSYKGSGRLTLCEVEKVLVAKADALCRESGNIKRVEVRCFLCPKALSPRNELKSAKRIARKKVTERSLAQK